MSTELSQKSKQQANLQEEAANQMNILIATELEFQAQLIKNNKVSLEQPKLIAQQSQDPAKVIHANDVRATQNDSTSYMQPKPLQESGVEAQVTLIKNSQAKIDTSFTALDLSSHPLLNDAGVSSNMINEGNLQGVLQRKVTVSSKTENSILVTHTSNASDTQLLNKGNQVLPQDQPNTKISIQSQSGSLKRSSTSLKRQSLFGNEVVPAPLTQEELNQNFIRECLDDVSNALKNEPDPGQGDFLKQALASAKITNTVITPFDDYETIQSITNPWTQNEYIVVQLVHCNVMPISQKFIVDNESTLSLIDKSPPRDSVNEIFSEEEEQSKDEFYATKKFIRRQLEEKTDLHHFYQDYENNLSSIEEIAQNTKISKNRNYPAANCDLKKVQNQAASDAKTKCIVSFWKFNTLEKDEVSFCYKQFTIENPVCLTLNRVKDTRGMIRREFLHFSHCKSYLYFFTHGGKCSQTQSEKQLFMSILDFYRVSQCQNEDSVPILGAKREFKGIVKDFVWKIFTDTDDSEFDKNNAAPILCGDDKTGLYLACQAQAIILKDPVDSLVKMVESDVQTMIFVNFETSSLQNVVLQSIQAKEVIAIQKIEYIVYDTIAFAHLTLQGLDKIVYVIHRDRKIKKLKWVSITEHFSSADEMKKSNCLLEKYFHSGHVFYQSCGKIEAFIHEEGQYCTYISQNDQWATFKLDSETQKAQIKRSIFGNNYRDFSIWRGKIGQQEILLSFGKLTKSDKQASLDSQSHFRQIQNCNLTCVNLQTSEETIYNLQLCTEMQRFSQKNYALYPLGPTQPGSSQYMAFHVFFRGQFSRQIKVCQVVAVRDDKAKQSEENKAETYRTGERLSQCQQLIIKHSEHQVSYPLLVYCQPTPIQNIIYMANLAVNTPQKRISIRPYRFLQFVKTTKNVYHFKNSEYLAQKTIYFLAEHEETRNVRLFYFLNKPWQDCIHTADNDKKIKQNRLKLMSGETKLPPMYKSQCKQEVMLLTKMIAYERIMALVIQQGNDFSQINVCYLDGSSEPEPFIINDGQNEKDQIMPLKIQPGPYSSCLYVSEGKSQNYQIMCAKISKSLNEKNEVFITHCDLYRQSQKIIAWQINHNTSFEISSEFEIQVIILDAAFNFRILGMPKQNIKQKSSDDLIEQFNVVKKIDLNKIGLHFINLVEKLSENQYSSLILGEKSITLPYYVGEKGAIEFRKKVLNLNSKTIYDFDYLGYPSNQSLLGETRLAFDLNSCEVLSVEHLSRVGKHFAIVREGSMSYFETTKNLELRRIDFMDYQMQSELIRQIKVLNDIIHVFISVIFKKKQREYCLVFDTKTLLLIDKIKDFTKTKIYTPMKNGYQIVREKQLAKLVRQESTESVKEKSIMKQDIERFTFYKYFQNGDKLAIPQDMSIDTCANKLLQLLDSSSSQKKLDNDPLTQVDKSNDSCLIKSLKCRYFVPRKTANLTVGSEGQIIYAVIPGRLDEAYGSVRKYTSDEIKYYESIVIKNRTKIQVLKTTIGTSIKDQTSDQYTPGTIIFSLYGPIFKLFQGLFNHLYVDQKSMKIQITKDYLVVLCCNYVLFINLQEIEANNNPKSVVQQWDSNEEPMDNYVSADVLNLHEMFDERQIIAGVRIDVILPTQLRRRKTAGEENKMTSGKLRRKPRENLIQITTTSTILLWDIDNNEQFQVVDGYDQFLSSENHFVNLGVLSMIPSSPQTGVRDVTTAKMVTNDGKRTVYCIPKVENVTLIAKCFTMFSELDAIEFNSIQQLINRNEVVEVIDPDCITSQVYSATIFQFFRDNPGLIAFIKDQIVAQNLEPYTTSQGVEYDNIYIRKVFHLLQLPHILEKNQRLTQQVKSLLFYDKAQQQFIRDRCKILYAKKGEQFTISFVTLNAAVHSAIHEQTRKFFLSSKNVIRTLLNEFNDGESDNSQISVLQEFIGLLQLSREKSLTDLVNEFEQFEKLFKLIKSSQSINHFMQSSLIETEMTKAHSTFFLDSDVEFLVFGSSTSQLSEVAIKERFTKTTMKRRERVFQKVQKFLADLNLITPTQKILRQVKVTIVEINWLNDSCRELFYFLASFYDPSIYKNELIKVILIKQRYHYQIILKFTLPYLLYMICSFVFQTYYITGENGSRKDGLFGGSGWSIFMKLSIIILSFWFLGVEVMQMIAQKWSYFVDTWNWVNIATYTSNLVILGLYIWSSGYDELNMAYATSVSSFLIWLQIFYWMRLFEETSFYVLLVIQAMYDIRYFLMMFFCCVAMFANAVLILDLAHANQAKLLIQEGQEEYTPLIPDVTGNNPINAVINQYLLGLGTYTLADQEPNGVKQLVWFYFFLATIIININFLNVLIAIVSDSYARITEARQSFALQQRTGIFADFISMVRINKTMKKHRFLYIMQPVEVADEPSDWSGSIDALKKILKQDSTTVRTLIETKMNRVQQQQAKLEIYFQENVDQIQALKDQLKSANDEIKSVQRKNELMAQDVRMILSLLKERK